MAVDPVTSQGNALGRYKVLRELGRGASGAVYEARERSSGALVALKKFDPALFNDPRAKFAGVFVKAVLSARRLKHRNIVEIRDAAESNATAYVAMELLEGASLGEMLRDGPLSIARAIQIAADIACGLEHAHGAGVVHRSLKPSNIFVLRSGGVKITDFAIGQLAETAVLSGERSGSVGYLSPEQARGDPVDARSDLFSLGAVLYEMLTGRAPFEGASPREIAQNILRAEPPPPSQVNPHVPLALDGIVASLLARHAGDRLPDAGIVLRDLQRVEEKLGLRRGADTDEPKPNGPAEPASPEPEPDLWFGTADPGGSSSPAPTRDAPPLAGPAKREPWLGTPDPDRFDKARPAWDDPPLTRPARFHDEAGIRSRPHQSRAERPAGSGSAIFSALALVLSLLAIGLTVGFHYWPGHWPDGSELRAAASRMRETLSTAIAPSPPIAPAPVAKPAEEAAATPAAAPPSPPPVAKTKAPRNPTATAPSPSVPVESESSVAGASDQAAPERTLPRKVVPRTTLPTTRYAEQKPQGTATLILAVAPHGEIYVDGQHYGTTPPMTTLDLEPGMHRIEIRSGTRSPYVTYMTVQPGDVRRIRHDFSAKPVRPAIRERASSQLRYEKKAVALASSLG